jgi:hypothetical protein
MLFKMESKVKEAVGVKNEGDQLLARGQDMGPLPTKLQAADSCEGILYYAISIPNDANVNESDGT